MKSSTQDQAEGKIHKVKGEIKEIAGKLSKDPDLEIEGKDEKIAGEVQEKVVKKHILDEMCNRKSYIYSIHLFGNLYSYCSSALHLPFF